MIYEYSSHRITLIDPLVVGVAHNSSVKKERSTFNSFMPSNSITITWLNVQLFDIATKHKWDLLFYYTLYYEIKYGSYVLKFSYQLTHLFPVILNVNINKNHRYGVGQRLSPPLGMIIYISNGLKMNQLLWHWLSINGRIPKETRTLNSIWLTIGWDPMANSWIKAHTYVFPEFHSYYHLIYHLVRDNSNPSLSSSYTYITIKGTDQGGDPSYQYTKQRWIYYSSNTATCIKILKQSLITLLWQIQRLRRTISSIVIFRHMNVISKCHTYLIQHYQEFYTTLLSTNNKRTKLNAFTH